MEVLGIFEKGIGTSDSAIVKRAIVRNKVREGEILHSEWKSKVQVLKSQLKNLFLTLDSQGEEKFRTIIDKVLPPAIKAVKFNGFVLEAPQKILLAKKMSGRTPYIKEIDWKKINVSQLNLTIIAEQLSKDNEYKLRIETAIKIDICTAPFRALYGYLKEHEQHKILGHDIHPRFNYPSWKKYLKDVQTSEIAMDRYKVAYINKFLNYCHDELDVSNGKVSSKLLEIVGDRATIEVAKRNKIAPHRKAKDRSDADDNILEDIGVTESSFRLDNAMTILEDVYL
jgi:hypothetical protein